MKKRMNGFFKIIPGFGAACLLAYVARYIESLLPIHIIGASVIALLLGMLINSFCKPTWLAPGLKFTSKKILKLAIILLGASLSVNVILSVGKMSLMVMVFTLLTCFGGGYLVGKALGLNWKLSNLISAGTGICGGSAIAAIAPVIDAEDKDIAYAMSATFLFDMAMIVLFPIMGRWMGLSDMAYGLWAGTAVNDTSSVVAAGYAFSEGAGDFATMVKLTRTLSIIPTVLVFTFINLRLKKKQSINTTAGKKVNIMKLFPWFIVGFIGLAIINSMGYIPANVSACAKDVIGLGTSFKEVRKSGFAPMMHGFIISALVVVVAIGVEWCMGLV